MRNRIVKRLLMCCMGISLVVGTPAVGWASETETTKEEVPETDSSAEDYLPFFKDANPQCYFANGRFHVPVSFFVSGLPNFELNDFKMEIHDLGLNDGKYCLSIKSDTGDLDAVLILDDYKEDDNSFSDLKLLFANDEATIEQARNVLLGIISFCKDGNLSTEDITDLYSNIINNAGTTINNAGISYLVNIATTEESNEIQNCQLQCEQNKLNKLNGTTYTFDFMTNDAAVIEKQVNIADEQIKPYQSVDDSGKTVFDYSKEGAQEAADIYEASIRQQENVEYKSSAIGQIDPETGSEMENFIFKIYSENSAAAQETTPALEPTVTSVPTATPEQTKAPVEYKDATTIKIVQQALNDAGYNCGTPDGVAGSGTSSAITQYQTDKGLSVNGLVTDELVQSLGVTEKVQQAVQLEQNKSSYRSDLTYDQMARTPDAYMGEKIKISGKVLQAETGDDICYARVAMNSDYDTVVFVTYSNDLLGYRLLEDDQITVYGSSMGVYSYEAVSGATITIPWLMADMIEM